MTDDNVLPPLDMEHVRVDTYRGGGTVVRVTWTGPDGIGTTVTVDADGIGTLCARERALGALAERLRAAAEPVAAYVPVLDSGVHLRVLPTAVAAKYGTVIVGPHTIPLIPPLEVAPGETVSYLPTFDEWCVYRDGRRVARRVRDGDAYVPADPDRRSS